MSYPLQSQVILFHKGCQHPIADRPMIIPDDRVRLRGELISEEFIESMIAMFPYAREALTEARDIIRYAIGSRCAPNLVELADGLADLDFVVEGTRLEFGIEGGAIAASVFTSNMAKLWQCPSCDGSGRGAGSVSVCSRCNGHGKISLKRPDGKTIKPEGWKPPDIAGLLRDQTDGNALTVGEIAKVL